MSAPWEQCKEHGRAEARVWACPTCLVELRAERDRLRALTFCGCGDQFSAHDPGTCGACVAGATCGKEIDKQTIERLTAERDRLQAALIACRPAVLRDLEEAARLADDFNGGAIRQACADRADHGRALIDTIDEAAKGGT